MTLLVLGLKGHVTILDQKCRFIWGGEWENKVGEGLQNGSVSKIVR